MEFIPAKCKFSARWLRHRGTIGLTKLVRLDTVFIKKEEVDGVVHDDDAHVVHITWCEEA